MIRCLCIFFAIVFVIGCGRAKPVEEDTSVVRTASLEEACEIDPVACDPLAFRYLEGRGTEVDLARAATLFEKACQAGVSKSCYHLGHLYERGAGVEADPQRAVSLYRLSCEGGVAQACNNLALLLAQRGEESAEVDNLQERGCEGGDGVSCFNLGFKAEKANPPKWSSAVRYYRDGCALKHAQSCSYLGVLYRYGRGTEKNEARGAELYLEACALGDIVSCNNVGSLYQRGIGVARDRSKAREYFSLACNSGFARGCTNLGTLSEGEKNPAVSAFERYEAACRAGDGKGCSRMGILQLGGKHGAEKDLAKARQSFESACNLKYGSGCSNLGVLYEDGIGMDRDFDAARVYYEDACRYGEFQGCHNLGTMYANAVGSSEPNVEKASEQFQIGCANGYGASCTSLAALYAGSRERRDQVAPLLKKGCQLGDAEACRKLKEVK